MMRIPVFMLIALMFIVVPVLADSTTQAPGGNSLIVIPTPKKQDNPVLDTMKSEAFTWAYKLADTLIDNAARFGITSDGIPLSSLPEEALVIVENLSEFQYSTGLIPFDIYDVKTGTIKLERSANGTNHLVILNDYRSDKWHHRRDEWLRYTNHSNEETK